MRRNNATSMLNCLRRFLCALVAAGILCLSACRKNAESATSGPLATPAPTAGTPSPASPTNPVRRHRSFPGGVSPLIVSMSPETIPFHNGNVPMGKYSLTYEIDNWEKATKALISVFIPGAGEVQKFDVDIQQRATIEFLLDASNYDLGPTVRFRALCPGSDSDWFIMGGDPVRFPHRPEPGQIGSVMPEYVLKGSPQSDVVQVYISGPQITKDCKPDAQVDGTNVELHNIIAFSGEIRGYLNYSDLQSRPVVSAISK